jgi:hypothetical protein
LTDLQSQRYRSRTIIPKETIVAISDATLLRAAGLSALLAIVALIVSGITIALFFGGAGAFWGPVNDLATAVALLGLVLPVLAVQRLARSDAGPWLDIVTIAALAGILLAATGQVLLVAGRISLETSFVTGGLGILPVFAWLVAVAVLALGLGILPAQVGWLAIGVVALSAALALIAGITLGPLVWIGSVALIVCLVGWLGSLALTLMNRSVTVA